MFSKHFAKRSRWSEAERRRESFLQSRKNVYVTDVEFVKGVFGSPSDTEAKMATILRRVIALQCKVKPEKVSYSDITGELELLMRPEGMIDWLLCVPNGYNFDSVFLDILHELDLLAGAPVKILPTQTKVLGFFSRLPLSEFEKDPTFGHWIRLATLEILQLLSDEGVEEITGQV